jgi:hypothetical protein
MWPGATAATPMPGASQATSAAPALPRGLRFPGREPGRLPLGLASGRWSALPGCWPRWSNGSGGTGHLLAAPGPGLAGHRLQDHRLSHIALAAFFPIYLNAASGAAVRAAGVAPGPGPCSALAGRASSSGSSCPRPCPRSGPACAVGLGLGFAYQVLASCRRARRRRGHDHGRPAHRPGRSQSLPASLTLAAAGWLCDVLLVFALRTAFKSARRQ